MAALTLLAMVISVACGSSTVSEDPGPHDENALVWEAWDQIDQSFAGREDLDVEAMVGSTLRSLLELADAPAYPFLAEVGRLRVVGRPRIERAGVRVEHGRTVEEDRISAIQRLPVSYEFE